MPKECKIIQYARPVYECTYVLNSRYVYTNIINGENQDGEHISIDF